MSAEQQISGTTEDAPAPNARPDTRLSGMVGNGRANGHADVRWVKDALAHLGRYADSPEPYRYIDRELVDAIEGYQRDCGLRRDGWLRPAARPRARCGSS